MGVSDWICFILGSDQEQKVYATFSFMKKEHLELKLSTFSDEIGELSDEPLEMYSHEGYQLDQISDWENPCEPGIAVITIREIPFYFPWEIKRLLLIGLNDKNSVLSVLPKDIINVIISFVDISKERNEYIKENFYKIKKNKDSLFKSYVVSSSPDEWAFYLKTEKKKEIEISYETEMPYQLGKEDEYEDLSDSQQGLLEYIQSDNDVSDLEAELGVSFGGKKEYWLSCIHPQFFIHIILNGEGTSPDLLYDIAKSDKIDKKLSQSWLDMTYDDALKEIRNYFQKEIKQYFSVDELKQLESQLRKSRIWNGYAIMSPCSNKKRNKPNLFNPSKFRKI